jgi:uncharacterized membrane protein YgcG
MKKLAPSFLVFLLLCPVTAQEVSLTPLKEDHLHDDLGLLDKEQRNAIISLLEQQSQNSLGSIYLDMFEKLPAV